MTRERLESVIRKLHSKSVARRVQAVEAMSAFEFDDVSAPLTIALRDANPLVRQQAAATLGTFKDYRAIALLIGAMKDADPGVREAVAHSFQKIAAESGGANPARSLEELSEQILNDVDVPENRGASHGQLAEEGGSDFKKWAEWAAGQLTENPTSTQASDKRRHTVTCPKCGENAELPRPPRFCPSCGQPMPP